MKKSIFATLVLLSCSFLLFQNCGKAKKTSNVTAGTLGSLSPEGTGSNTITTSSMEDADTKLEIPDEIWDDFKDAGECKWSFTDSSGETSDLDTTGQSLTLNDVQMSEAGLYTATCMNEEQVTLVWFLLMVLPETPTQATGTYTGKFLLPDGSDFEFADIDGVSRAAALSNCKANYDLNPQLGIHCTWKDEVIYHKDVVMLELGDFSAQVIDSDDNLLLEAKGTDLPKDIAEEVCDALKEEYPDDSVSCMWNDEEIK